MKIQTSTPGPVSIGVAQVFCNQRADEFSKENPSIPRELVLGALCWRVHRIKDAQQCVNLEEFKAEDTWLNLSRYWDHRPNSSYWDRDVKSIREKWEPRLKAAFAFKVVRAMEAGMPSKKPMTKAVKISMARNVITRMRPLRNIGNVPTLRDIDQMARQILAEKARLASQKRDMEICARKSAKQHRPI